MQAEQREYDTQRAAAQREQNAFGQKLTDDAPRTGAQRGADRNFFLAGHGARQQQIGHVGAGDQQDAGDRAEQDQQGAARVADHLLLQRDDAESQAAIGRIVLRMIVAQAGGERIHFGLGLGRGDAGLEFADDVVVLVVAVLGGIGLHRKRQQDLRLIFGSVQGGQHFAGQRK